MKHLLIATSLLLSPAFALAAFDDVTLTTDTVIQVGSYTLNISGSSATIESISVDAASFSVTLASGSTFTVSSPTRNRLQTNTSTGVTNTCTSNTSSLLLSSAGTVVVTPTATVCADSAAPTQTSSSGSSAPWLLRAATPSPTASVSTPSPSPSPARISTTLYLGTSGPEVVKLQKLLTTLGLFKGQATGYFGPVTLAAVKSYQASEGINPVGHVGPLTLAALNAESPTTPSPSPSPISNQDTFTRDLTLGSTGADVKKLQEYLNAKGYIITTSGPGSPGNETTLFGALTRSALMKFQTASGIPATGFFGPLTRAAFNK